MDARVIEYDRKFDSEDYFARKWNQRDSPEKRWPEQPQKYRKPQTFHCFPRLPLELREIIWALSLPGPRLIEVSVQMSSLVERLQSADASAQWASFFAANPHRPAVLWVSQESRRVALRTFEYCFTILLQRPAEALPPFLGSDWDVILPSRKNGVVRSGVLFQPDRDTIYFRGDHGKQHSLRELQSRIKMSNIKSVAIDDWHGHFASRITVWPCLFGGVPHFPSEAVAPLLSGLEELFVIRLSANKLQGEQDEELEDINWRGQVTTLLSSLSSPISPVIKPMRKSRLWDPNGSTRWSDQPHWMPHHDRIQLRENLRRRHYRLNRRADSLSS